MRDYQGMMNKRLNGTEYACVREDEIISRLNGGLTLPRRAEAYWADLTERWYSAIAPCISLSCKAIPI